MPSHSNVADLLANNPSFAQVLSFIQSRYQHQPTSFQNGTLKNAASENQGSAQVFAFAQAEQLDKEQTLALFAEHYAAVLATADGTDHQNIRQFMQHGWDGIQFDGQVLIAK